MKNLELLAIGVIVIALLSMVFANMSQAGGKYGQGGQVLQNSQATGYALQAKPTEGIAALGQGQKAAAKFAPAQKGVGNIQVKSGVQEITLTVQGGSYYPNPIRVKKGTPVRLVADLSQMSGCSRSIVIPEFGISKVLSNTDNTIEFTPTKSGTFDFSCSMGMYQGKIVVEEADGTVAAYEGIAPKRAAGGTCGMGGGCGCGG
ncbi:hypothetical protein FJZ26_02155 [Candidatus Parvarchaeota archaeon]|nr:hypothetical protein [Candidatus Parvarchaeota archaeon]